LVGRRPTVEHAGAHGQRNAPCPFSRIRSMQADSGSLRGKLLVASPALIDPNFRRSVVLVTEHSDDGAVGLVLTRPSSTSVSDAVPQLEGLVEGDASVYLGGPVEPSAVVVLAEFEDPSQAARIVFDNVGFLPAQPDPDGGRVATRRARVFAGYAGWAPDQLEAELALSSWIVEPPERDDVFSDAAGLWSAVLRRKGGQFAIIALMPPDPSLN
jgi:putative transcriptional regulator